MNVILTSLPLSKIAQGSSNHISAHQTVMGLFPPLGDNPRSEAGVLFRVQPGLGTLLIQSTAIPSPQQVDELDGRSKTIALEEWKPGDRFEYQIDVAAVRRIRSVERRLPSSEIPDWWSQLAERNGFEVLGELSGHLFGTKDRTGKGAQPHLRVATMQGVGAVTSGAALLKARMSGLGRARGYGCGLLTALRIP